MHRETFQIDFQHSCEVTIATPRAVDVSTDEPLPADIPMVIALHGYGQNEDHMRRFMSPIADHPFIWVYPRAVYPFEMRQPEKTRIGNAWYMYTGDQDDLRDSMLTSTKHILNVREEVIKRYGERPCAIVGFSQGGYLAGVVGANHPECFKAVACLTGRLKHEFMPDGNSVKLAQFHGLDDQNVSPDLAREAVEATRAKGFEVDHFEIKDTAHGVSESMANELGDWLKGIGLSHIATANDRRWLATASPYSIVFCALLSLTYGCSSNPYKHNPIYDQPESRATAAQWLNRAMVEGAEMDTMKRFRAFGVSRINVDEVRMEWNDVSPRGRNDFKVLRRELAFHTIKMVSRPRYQGDFWDIFVDATGGGVTFHFKDNQNAATAEAALRRLMRPIPNDEMQRLGRGLCRSLDQRGQVSADWAESSLKVLTGQDFGKDTEKWHLWLNQLEVNGAAN